MSAIALSLPPEIRSYVRREVSKGEFNSEKDLMVEAVKVLRELRRRHARLRADIQSAIEQADRGQTARLDMNAIKRKAHKRWRSSKRRGD